MASSSKKNILITGAAGFIGSHVAKLLVDNYNIFIIDRLDYCASLRNLESIEGRFKFFKGDISSEDFVSYILKNEKIDIIMNFAAYSHVDNSFANSIMFTKNNVLGTHILLECSRIHNISLFIHVSTDEVYGETLEIMDENSILTPTNPYAATKAAAEMLCQAYYKSYQLPIIITRGNNVYGPHQYPEKLIPKFINLLLNDQPCTIHGTGNNTRSFLYVEDVAQAFLTILEKGVVGQIYNIGTDFEISNIEVAKVLCQHFNKNPDQYITYVEDRKFNDRRYNINSSKIELLGWKSETSWEEGIGKTIEWYKKNIGYW